MTATIRYLVILLLGIFGFTAAATAQRADTTQEADPFAEILALAEKLESTADQAARTFTKNKSKAAEKLPAWQLLLSSSKQVRDRLSGAIKEAEAVLESQQEEPLPTDADERAFVERQHTAIEEEIDSMFLKVTGLSDAVAALDKQIATIASDSTVKALVKAKKARGDVNDRLRDLNKIIEDIGTGAIGKTPPE